MLAQRGHLRVLPHAITYRETAPNAQEAERSVALVSSLVEPLSVDVSSESRCYAELVTRFATEPLMEARLRQLGAASKVRAPELHYAMLKMAADDPSMLVRAHAAAINERMRDVLDVLANPRADEKARDYCGYVLTRRENTNVTFIHEALALGTSTDFYVIRMFERLVVLDTANAARTIHHLIMTHELSDHYLWAALRVLKQVDASLAAEALFARMPRDAYQYAKRAAEIIPKGSEVVGQLSLSDTQDGEVSVSPSRE